MDWISHLCKPMAQLCADDFIQECLPNKKLANCHRTTWECSGADCGFRQLGHIWLPHDSLQQDHWLQHRPPYFLEICGSKVCRVLLSWFCHFGRRGFYMLSPVAIRESAQLLFRWLVPGRILSSELWRSSMRHIFTGSRSWCIAVWSLVKEARVFSILFLHIFLSFLTCKILDVLYLCGNHWAPSQGLLLDEVCV